MERIDAFVTKKTPPRAMAEGLRNGIKNMAECYGFDYHDRLEWLVADTIDRLSDDIDVLTKERDAAVADLTVFDKCKICKHYDEKSANYGYTELCENCGAYPWADDEEPNRWEWRGVQEDNDEID